MHFENYKYIIVYSECIAMRIRSGDVGRGGSKWSTAWHTLTKTEGGPRPTATVASSGTGVVGVVVPLRHTSSSDLVHLSTRPRIDCSLNACVTFAI